MSLQLSGGRFAEIFDLHGRGRAVVLDLRGIHHPASARSTRQVFTPYDEITHLASTSRAVWIGARRSVYLLPRGSFVDANGAEHLVRGLLTRIAQRPGGSAQLARMAEIEETARNPAPLRATRGLALACLAAYAVHLAVGPVVQEVGSFHPALVRDGDFWRIVTANLLHAAPKVPLHLFLNLVALFALGTLVERPLGAARTLCIMGISALGAMIGSTVFAESEVVGVSGVVLGLAGAVLWLELRCNDRLPAWWRFPRALFIAILLANALLGLLLYVLPIFPVMLANGAHLGGFLAGLVAAALVTGPRLGAEPAPATTRAAAAAMVALTLFSVAAAGQRLLTVDDYIAYNMERLASLPGLSPLDLNNRAWLVAVDEDSTRAQIEAALMLAERAVEETGRGEPTILDTLAEVHFQLGQIDEALGAIDEAIAKAPFEPYYREQRKRFTGERAEDDRPASPDLLPGPRQGPPVGRPEPDGIPI